jgi:hypothetical protein
VVPGRSILMAMIAPKVASFDHLGLPELAQMHELPFQPCSIGFHARKVAGLVIRN